MSRLRNLATPERPARTACGPCAAGRGGGVCLSAAFVAFFIEVRVAVAALRTGIREEG